MVEIIQSEVDNHRENSTLAHFFFPKSGIFIQTKELKQRKLGPPA